MITDDPYGMLAGFDARTVRLSSPIGTDLFTAECQLTGCGWTMGFSWGAQRLGTIVDVCAAHPCKGQPVTEDERLSA